MAEKTPNQQLAEKLLFKPAYVGDKSAAVKQEAHAFAEGYKKFLDAGKTEREVAAESEQMLKDAGYQLFDPKKTYAPGDKVYFIQLNKAVVASTIGTRPYEEGFHLVIAHTDSPRLDLRPNPLYESDHFSYFKTHYYGGIRKYQWLSIPLELHGVVIRKDGTSVQVRIGGEPGDPVLAIPDLLPHLAGQQSQKPLGTAVDPENLNLFVGSRPFPGSEGGDRVKLAVLDLLNRKYGITEEDFLSAELSAVPAYTACDVGLDRSMIGGYGQDDRVCAYAALKGLFDAEKRNKTAVCILADKEEIGSDGVSGMQSQAFDTFIADLCEGQGVSLRECLEHSFCLSADVTACYDPNFASVYDKRNSSLINRGVGLCKYTGSRGKAGASDASAEVMGYIRGVLDQAGVLWHVAELGKVDVGGGGTVAVYMANRNIDTVDAGVSVLGMHAPFEVTGKLDCYMSYRSMKAVFEQ